MTSRTMLTGAVFSMVMMLLGSVLAASQVRGADSPPLNGDMERFQLLTPPEDPPGLALPAINGAETMLRDFRGKVVVLNFWATWCAPCVAEMPSLDRLQATMGPVGVQVVAISTDRGGRKVIDPFLEKHGLEHLTILLDQKSQMARALKARALPTTFILDAEGKIRGSLTGAAEWDSPAAMELIRYFLAPAAPLGGETIRAAAD